MAHYWISFRIKDDATYDHRYAALTGAMNDNGSGFWSADTSFVAIEAALDIDALGARLKAALNASTDHLVMREIGKDSTRYVGNPGEGFEYFFPKAKKL